MNHYHLATRGDCDGLWDWNLSTNRVHFAPRWVAMVGCEDHEVGQTPDEWMGRIHPEDRAEVEREVDVQLGGGGSEFTLQHRMLHKNGTYRWVTCHAAIVRDEGGRATRMMGYHADATTDRIADAVTGLPNRQLFLDRIARAIDQGRRERESVFAVLVLGLDRPDAPEPEDAGAWDLLLPAVARRLETCLRSGDAPANSGRDDLVARLGGDQFGILLEGLADVSDAQGGGQRILTSLLAPFPAASREVFVQGCVGIAVSVTGYCRAEDVLRDAAAALHRANALGAGRCEVFDTTLLESVRTRLELESDLEKAVERREFVLFYQPIVSLASNRVADLEALVRWQHPTRGLVLPLDFLPLAEETGAIGRIGAWVVREACRQLADWHSRLALPPGLWVSVNVSGVQFRDPTLFTQIGDAVRDAGLDPRCLMVELTESTVMESPATARGLVMQLRVMGVRVGLDDFGTGHSALSYLHQFPADFLKLDQSFIRGVEARQDMAEIVRTVNDLADRLGLEVVAEGIERGEQLAVSRSLKCGYVQGFLLARPADAEQTAALLQAGLKMPGEPEACEGPATAPADESQGRPARRAVELAGDCGCVRSGLADRRGRHRSAYRHAACGRRQQEPRRDDRSRRHGSRRCRRLQSADCRRSADRPRLAARRVDRFPPRLAPGSAQADRPGRGNASAEDEGARRTADVGTRGPCRRIVCGRAPPRPRQLHGIDGRHPRRWRLVRPGQEPGRLRPAEPRLPRGNRGRRPRHQDRPENLPVRTPPRDSGPDTVAYIQRIRASIASLAR